MKTMNRLVAGIFSMILIGTIIIAPVYIAEQLEKIETASSNIVSAESVLGGSISYQPYQELNDNTKSYKRQTWASAYTGWEIVDSTNIHHGGLNCNVDGTIDMGWDDGNTIDRFYFYMEFDIDDMIANNTNQIYLWMNISVQWKIIYLVYEVVKNTDNTHDISAIINNQVETDFGTGERSVIYEITEAEMNQMKGFANSYLNPSVERQHIQIVVEIETPIAWPVVYFDYQISPEYYEIVEGDEGSIAIPYILTITPYAVHQVAMGIGGILILAVGWIASPWGERFDKFLPINSTTRRKGKHGIIKRSD